MFAPHGSNSGSSSYNGSTWIFNRMTVFTGGTGSSDVDDFDDFCQAQLAFAALFAQGVVNNVQSLMFAEGTWSDVRFGVVAVEVGAKRIWIGMVVVSRLRISILYSVHVQIHWVWTCG